MIVLTSCSDHSYFVVKKKCDEWFGKVIARGCGEFKKAFVVIFRVCNSISHNRNQKNTTIYKRIDIQCSSIIGNEITWKTITIKT